MNITWLGHSCFVVESAGWRVVLDPYYVETYPALHIEADEALCSHGHRDHDFLEAVTLLGRDKSESPFTVETVSTFHDDKKGSLRGENAIHILRAEGMTLVHCGDLGHELNEEQLAAVKGCDALLIPVGGYYTIDAKTAKRSRTRSRRACSCRCTTASARTATLRSAHSMNFWRCMRQRRSTNLMGTLSS